MIYDLLMWQGDSKGSAKGGDASAKRDVYQSPNGQVENVYYSLLLVVLLEI